MPEPLVTACMIVRDEEDNLPRCLASLKPLVDEIVIVDTGSTDATMDIARRFEARVYEEPWQDDFSLHRNQALEKATGRWVLVIDADEELVDTDVAETRERLEQDGLPNILMVSLRLHYPGDKKLAMVAPRMARRDAGIRYVFPVHEQLDVEDAPAALSNIVLDHHGYNDPEALIRKEQRNLRLAESMGEGGPHKPHCITRAAFSTEDWAKTVVNAREVLASDASAVLKTEACSLGAAAAFNAKDSDAMAEFVSAGIDVAPDSPDSRLVALLAAMARYLHTLRDGDSTSGGLMVRPTVFHHDAELVKQAYAVLGARTRRTDTSETDGPPTGPVPPNSQPDKE